ncbi:MAG TPA: response regulator [Nitrososphaera sp.]|nr:response regulator [Nitrososphaera sp.]
MGLRNASVHTIMIIEDEDDILQVYKDFLERKGYAVEVSAPTANEAVKDYETYKPDLIMIDYRLPGAMNGLQAAERILRVDPFARILMVTASENIGRELASNAFLSDKMISVVRKPVRLANLAKTISSF